MGITINAKYTHSFSYGKTGLLSIETTRHQGFILCKFIFEDEVVTPLTQVVHAVAHWHHIVHWVTVLLLFVHIQVPAVYRLLCCFVFDLTQLLFVLVGGDLRLLPCWRDWGGEWPWYINVWFLGSRWFFGYRCSHLVQLLKRVRLSHNLNLQTWHRTETAVCNCCY